MEYPPQASEASLAFHGGMDPHAYCFDNHSHDFAESCV